MRVLLDTSAYSALHRGHPAVVEQVRRSSEVLLSSIVVGELLFGFRCGSRYERNLEDLQAFLDDPNVRMVPVTWNTADHFSRISAALKNRGRPIPTNDIWIAAHAMETEAELLTSDGHFDEVEGLSKQTFTPL